MKEDRKRVVAALIEAMRKSDPSCFIRDRWRDEDKYGPIRTLIDGDFDMDAVARGAIEALRKPTKAMLKAPPAPEDRRSINLEGTRGTVDDFLDNWTAKAVWRAMIDELLRD